MNLLLFFATVIPSLGGLYFGLVAGVIGGISGTPTFNDYFGITGTAAQISDTTGNIVSILQAGACIGALTANLLADKIGRQKPLIINSVIYLIGAALQTGSQNLPMLLFGRFCCGWGVGACTMISPMYVAEIAPLNTRGRVGALWQLNISGGMCIIFWINYGCLMGLSASDLQWRLPLGLQLVPGIVMAFGMFFLPESVRWLVLRDRVEEATINLSRLRGKPISHPDIIGEIDLIISAVKNERKFDGSRFKELLHSYNVRRILIGCFLQLAQQWTGVTVINYYGPSIFKMIGFNSSLSSMMTGAVKVFLVIISFLFLDHGAFGRRPLLLVGSVANTIIFFVLGGLLYYIMNEQAAGLTPSPAAGYVCIVLIYLFAVSMEFAWNPVPWIYCSEIFPNRIRAICISMTTAMNWASNAIIGKVSPIMIESITYGTFFFYAGLAVVMFVVVLLFVPETQGRSLEEIDAVRVLFFTLIQLFINMNNFIDLYSWQYFCSWKKIRGYSL
ncbi:general substrate transporter [Backusella circina FSU 941]|nr:general substrate transporter [Backusella circina FSU 941]